MKNINNMIYTKKILEVFSRQRNKEMRSELRDEPLAVVKIKRHRRRSCVRQDAHTTHTAHTCREAENQHVKINN